MNLKLGKLLKDAFDLYNDERMHDPEFNEDCIYYIIEDLAKEHSLSEESFKKLQKMVELTLQIDDLQSQINDLIVSDN